MLPQNLHLCLFCKPATDTHPYTHFTPTSPGTLHPGNNIEGISWRHLPVLPVQFTALLIGSWDKFWVWSHFRCPVACKRRSFHSPFCAFLLALVCSLLPPALQQLGCNQGSCFNSQLGRKKQKALQHLSLYVAAFSHIGSSHDFYLHPQRSQVVSGDWQHLWVSMW